MRILVAFPRLKVFQGAVLVWRGVSALAVCAVSAQREPLASVWRQSVNTEVVPSGLNLCDKRVGLKPGPHKATVEGQGGRRRGNGTGGRRDSGFL